MYIEGPLHYSDFGTWKKQYFKKFTYRKVASSNTSCLEAHAGLFRLSMQGIFDAYVLWPFGKSFIFELVTRFRSPDYMVSCNSHLCDFSDSKVKNHAYGILVIVETVLVETTIMETALVETLLMETDKRASSKRIVLHCWGRESWSILLNRVWPKSNDENCDPPTEKLDIPIDDLLHYG